MNTKEHSWERSVQTASANAFAPNLIIDNGLLCAHILPDAGGGLARLDVIRGNDRFPVLRPLGRDTDPYNPDNLACYPLVPWSNRIAQGRFKTSDGRLVTIGRNRTGEIHPIHGYGWQRRWQVDACSHHAATLTLDYRMDGAPFAFVSTIHYELVDSTLQVVLTVTNRGSAMPYGLGLHPWLPRSADVTLRASASGMWDAGPDRLPTAHIPIPENFYFGHIKRLPRESVDNAFTGWNGNATVIWPESGVSMEIRSNVMYYVLYAPAGKDFFCFEPVDHPVNAHNLPGKPTEHGLSELEPGESLTRIFAFDVNVHALGTGNE